MLRSALATPPNEDQVAELREAQAQLGRQSQVDRINPHVQQVLLDGSYEVVEELAPDQVDVR